MWYWPISSAVPILEIQSYLGKANNLLFSPREEGRGERRREKPIKMVHSFSLHSSLVSPHEFIWWQTIPTPPPPSPVCTHTHTHGCISSIKMIHREAPPRLAFLKMRDDASQLPSMIHWCRSSRFWIHAIGVCFFPPLLCLGVVVREVSNTHLQIPPYQILLSSLPAPPLGHLPPHPLPGPSHWSLSPAYLYSSVNLSFNSVSLSSSPRCFLTWSHQSWGGETHMWTSCIYLRWIDVWHYPKEGSGTLAQLGHIDSDPFRAAGCKFSPCFYGCELNRTVIMPKEIRCTLPILYCGCQCLVPFKRFNWIN